MTSISARVYGALANTGTRVVYSHPASDAALPVIAWRESGNSEYAQADGAEYLTKLEYAVDVYAANMTSLMDIADAADARLRALGLKRSLGSVLYDASDRQHRWTAVYRGIAAPNGRIYRE